MIYGVWDVNGKCHGIQLTAEQAGIVAGRCERLLKKSQAPFFAGEISSARAMGFKDERGEVL